MEGLCGFFLKSKRLILSLFMDVSGIKKSVGISIPQKNKIVQRVDSTEERIWHITVVFVLYKTVPDVIMNA